MWHPAGPYGRDGTFLGMNQFPGRDTQAVGWGDFPPIRGRSPGPAMHGNCFRRFGYEDRYTNDIWNSYSTGWHTAGLVPPTTEIDLYRRSDFAWPRGVDDGQGAPGGLYGGPIGSGEAYDGDSGPGEVAKVGPEGTGGADPQPVLRSESSSEQQKGPMPPAGRAETRESNPDNRNSRLESRLFEAIGCVLMRRLTPAEMERLSPVLAELRPSAVRPAAMSGPGGPASSGGSSSSDSGGETTASASYASSTLLSESSSSSGAGSRHARGGALGAGKQEDGANR